MFNQKKRAFNLTEFHLFLEKKKIKNPRKSQTTVDSKTHPHFWESYCSEFVAWYVMLVGMLKLSSEVNFSSNTASAIDSPLCQRWRGGGAAGRMAER